MKCSIYVESNDDQETDDPLYCHMRWEGRMVTIEYLNGINFDIEYARSLMVQIICRFSVELSTDKEDVQTLRDRFYHSIFISGGPHF